MKALLAALLMGFCWCAHAASREFTAVVETTGILALSEQPLPVTPGTKYLLVFTAKTGGQHTVEANQRVRIMDHRVANRLRLQFHDQDAKAVGRRLDVMVLSQQWHTYAQAFYPPTEARSVSLSLVSGEGESLAAKEIRLSDELTGDEAACINPHPRFEFGDLNQYGYRCGYGGRFYERPDGKTVWKSGFCGYTPRFPVKANTFYTVTCAGKPYRDRKSAIYLECYGATGTKPFKSMRVAISEAGTATDLLVPEGTVSVDLLCYYMIFGSIRVTERPTPLPTEEKP